MKALTTLCLTGLLVLASATGYTKENNYQGQEVREIKSLSQSDIDAIEKGSGWGLAKPAELNGVPGPAHVLEMQKELGLSKEQINQIQILWQEMNAAAKQHGLSYLSAEREIEHFFRQENKDQQQLSRLLEMSAQSLAELRQAHLVAHIKTKPLLSKHQVKLYNKLRGYTSNSHHHKTQHH